MSENNKEKDIERMRPIPPLGRIVKEPRSILCCLKIAIKTIRNKTKG